MYKLIILLLLALPIGVFAQTVTTGTVFDFSKKNLSLPGVSIRNLNSKKSTSTNKDGKYTINANIGDLLEFSAVGYHTDTLYLTNLLNRTIYLPVKTNSLKDVDIKDDAFKGVEAIIQSMTVLERRNPDLLSTSRKQRIAKGAGKDIGEINAFMKQFDQMKQMMKQMSSGSMPGKMPGLRR